MVATTHEQASRMGALRAIALCKNFGGVLDYQAGRWDAAEASLREAVELYRKISSASGESLSLQRLGVLLTARGRLDEAMAVLGEGVFAAERATMRSHCLTRLYASMARNRLAASDLAAADELMRLGDHTARRHGHCVTCNALLLPEAVRVAIALGRLDEADGHARGLEEIAAQYASRAWVAMARSARGRVLAARGRHADAIPAFREARDAFLAIDGVYEAARCARAEATCRAALGEEELAERLGREAADAFRTLGAAALES